MTYELGMKSPAGIGLRGLLAFLTVGYRLNFRQQKSLTSNNLQGFLIF